MPALKRISKILLERVEGWFDAAFGPAANPLYQLGALGYFFFWIVCVSGIYLYIFFDTGVTEAYESIERITSVQWYAGGVMRSLHRYASDALVIVMVLHLVREYLLGRFRGARFFSWVTGVPILWLVFACGITGYWLVWDKLAQYVAVMTTEWLDTLGIFGEPIARNFLNEAALSGRFFTLMVFIHIFVPLALLLVMWIHVQRTTRARVNPPKTLAIGTLGMLLALSLIKPALSQGGPANLNLVPAVVGLDWFYLPMYPLLDEAPGIALWAALGAMTLLLLIVPWLPPRRRDPAAVVDLDNCNGCGRCFADCPFGAVVMGARTDGRGFEEQAIVKPALCTSCGICVGACPTATPFRRATELVSGIDLPQLSAKTLRERTIEASTRLSGEDRVIVYGCGAGADLRVLASSGVAVVSLPCTGMLPPSLLDYAITRGYAEGVFLTGCRHGDCDFRLGIQWTEQRLAGTRDPFLRKRVPRARIGRYWGGLADTTKVKRAIEAFRKDLRNLGPYRRPTLASTQVPPTRAKGDHA